MVKEHPVGQLVRYWMIVNAVILISISLVWLYLLYDYPRVYSIFVVQPGSVITMWRFAVVIGMLIISILGLYGFAANHKLCIQLFLGFVSVTLFILHGVIFLNSQSDSSFSTLSMVHGVVDGVSDKVKNWRPASELGVDKIKQLALNATTGEKLNLPFPLSNMVSGGGTSGNKEEHQLRIGADNLPFSGMILACCGPFDAGHGPRRHCYREDMQAKDSSCSAFYVTVGATNHLALVVLTSLFWLIHALSSLKLVAHKLPTGRKATPASEGQTYIVPEGRVKSYDQSDYSGSSAIYQESPV